MKAARNAFENGPWSQLTPSEGGRLIWKLADLMEQNLEELAEVESLDNGKPLKGARVADVPFAVDLFRDMACWATKIEATQFPCRCPIHPERIIVQTTAIAPDPGEDTLDDSCLLSVRLKSGLASAVANRDVPVSEVAPLIPSSTNCRSGGTGVLFCTPAERGYLTFDCVRRLLFTGDARVENGPNCCHRNLLGEAFSPADGNQARDFE